jgi:hypothetical protein
MTLGIAHLSPIAALATGVVILLFPRILNLMVALYLIFVGILGLNEIHHFFG